MAKKEAKTHAPLSMGVTHTHTHICLVIIIYAIIYDILAFNSIYVAFFLLVAKKIFSTRYVCVCLSDDAGQFWWVCF